MFSFTKSTKINVPETGQIFAYLEFIQNESFFNRGMSAQVRQDGSHYMSQYAAQDGGKKDSMKILTITTVFRVGNNIKAEN